jgi:predicted metal-dependent phosphoesterase TrpH
MGSVIFKKPPLKKLKKEGLFGVDLHFHTKYSLDAVSRIPAAVKKAQKKGFGFAITDHNTIDGIKAAYRLRKHPLIIPGIEITCKNGNHILAYFYHHKDLEEFFNKKLKPRMKKNPFFIDISLSEVLQMSKDCNYLVCAAHPYAPGATGIMRTGISKKAEKNIKLIEVINGFNFRKANMNAIYWASKTNKAITGGSDGHSTFELGKVLTFTHADDIESVFKEILKNKSIVIGKEDNLFLKAVMTIRKESAYVARSKKQHMAKTLLKSQFGSEYRYIRERFKSGRAYHMLTHHHEELAEKKNK